MNTLFDLIVIGTGSGASVAARKCKKAGWKVAIIDEKPYGGTCALRGCDMKKILMGVAEITDWNNRMRGNGIDAYVNIVWSDLMAFKRSFIEKYSENVEKRWKESGIETFHGIARFVSKDEIEVAGQILKGEHILIAAGARPMPLAIPGEEHISFSDYFLEMNSFPEISYLWEAV